MDFDVTVAHSVDQIGPEAWDRLSDGRLFASFRWYRYGEAVMADATPVYIILSQNGEPMARATFWLTWKELLPVTSKPIARVLEAMLRRWPLMMCRSPLSSVSGLTLPDPPLRDAALLTLVQVAQEQARQHHALFMGFDYLAQQEAAWASWPEAFIRFTFSDPGTYLPIVWPDFESYLADLSQKTRKSYRRNCRAANAMGIEIKEQRTVTAIEEAMVLIRNVEARHNSLPNPWMRAMLENAHQVDSAWLTAERAGRLVGCELMLGDGDAWFLTALGRDYDAPLVYFLLGYADIRYAIEHGVRVLRWGSGAYETKERFGFQLEHNNITLFTTGNRVLRRLTRRLIADGNTP